MNGEDAYADPPDFSGRSFLSHEFRQFCSKKSRESLCSNAAGCSRNEVPRAIPSHSCCLMKRHDNPKILINHFASGCIESFTFTHSKQPNPEKYNNSNRPPINLFLSFYMANKLLLSVFLFFKISISIEISTASAFLFSTSCARFEFASTGFCNSFQLEQCPVFDFPRSWPLLQLHRLHTQRWSMTNISTLASAPSLPPA